MNCRIIIRMIFFILVVYSHLVLAQSPSSLYDFLKPVAIKSVPKSLQENLWRYTSRSSTRNFWVVEIPDIENLFHANSLKFSLESKKVVVNLKDVEILNEHEFIWSGDISGKGNHITIAKTAQGLTGVIIYENELYKLEPLGHNLHLLSLCNYDSDSGEYGCTTHDSDAEDETGVGKTKLEIPKKSISPYNTKAAARIDVLAAYTSSAKNAHGSIPGLINTARSETNSSYSSSGVKASIRIVDKMQVNYNESGKNYDQHLSWIREE